MNNTATQSQISFINSLKGQCDQQDPQVARTLEIARTLWESGDFDKKAASAVIDSLKSLKTTPATTPKIAPAPEGMHIVGETIYKVQKAVHGSGRTYAKVLTQDEDGTWYFEYAPGVVRDLSEDTLMDLAKAKEFGLLYGVCVQCGRTLTDEKSIEAGIGPVCAKKF